MLCYPLLFGSQHVCHRLSRASALQPAGRRPSSASSRVRAATPSALYTSSSTRTMSTLSQTAGSLPPRMRSLTTSVDSQEDQLALALDNIIATNQPFALNYVLTSERIWGGQALVQVRPAQVLTQRSSDALVITVLYNYFLVCSMQSRRRCVSRASTVPAAA